MLAICRGAGGGGLVAGVSIPLLRNRTKGFALGFGRDAHQPGQTRDLVCALPGKIEEFFADAAMAAEHVGQERKHEEDEADDEEDAADGDEGVEGGGLAVPQIPAGHEAEGEDANQSREHRDAPEEFQRLNVAHGAKDDRKTVAGIFEYAAGDAAFAVLAHAANLSGT